MELPPAQKARPKYEPSKLRSTLNALQSPVRFMVVAALLDGDEFTVAQLNRFVPQCSQSSLSQHLTTLRRAKIVSTRRHSQHIFYKLHDKQMVFLMRAIHRVYTDDNWFSRIDAMKEARRVN